MRLANWDAARLALAQQFGRIRMVLRSGEDAGEVMLSRINTKNIFRAVRFAPQKPSAPTPVSPEIDLASVEYIIGGRGGATAAAAAWQALRSRPRAAR